MKIIYIRQKSIKNQTKKGSSSSLLGRSSLSFSTPPFLVFSSSKSPHFFPNYHPKLIENIKLDLKLKIERKKNQETWRNRKIGKAPLEVSYFSSLISYICIELNLILGKLHGKAWKSCMNGRAWFSASLGKDRAFGVLAWLNMIISVAWWCM